MSLPAAVTQIIRKTTQTELRGKREEEEEKKAET